MKTNEQYIQAVLPQYAQTNLALYKREALAALQALREDMEKEIEAFAQFTQSENWRLKAVGGWQQE